MENCAPFHLFKRLPVEDGRQDLLKDNANSVVSPLPRMISEMGSGFGCQFDIIPYRNGSVSVQVGKTKLICSCTVRSNTTQFTPAGILKCEVKYPVFSGYLPNTSCCVSPALNSNLFNSSAHELYLAKQVLQAIEPSVRLNQFPKMVITLRIVVLDTCPHAGYDVCAAVIASSLALVSAKVEVLDVVSACTLHYFRSSNSSSASSAGSASTSSSSSSATTSTVPTSTDAAANVTMTVCMMTRLQEQTHMVCEGRVGASKLLEMQAASADGCKVSRRAMEQHIQRFIEKQTEVVEETMEV